MSGARIVELGDACLALQFDAGIDELVNARCVEIAARLEHERLVGVRDVIPSYNAVTVHFDGLTTDRRALRSHMDALGASAIDTAMRDGDIIELPASYGGEDGPDLGAVAAFAGCSEAEVVRLHASRAYRVFMVGFLPGFPYMGPVDARIAMPRLDTPRQRVRAGSIGIAGAQTGVYPCDTPGGWRIIARTGAVLFDASRPQPFLVKAGDRVRFVEA